MADDPNRDILPVKDGSCIETYRSTLVAGLLADPRERHTVCKLDRYDLEDRYLCLLDETQALKKLSNAQEDKLKRLTTKLMRISASSRPCIAAALTIDNDKIRIEELERENSKLKDRIYVLKNQILSHKALKKSPPRRCLHCISSRPTTCRSEGARTKISTSTNYEDGKADFQSQNDVRIDELEQQRQDMISRISQLEDELINCKTELQKTKVHENIEYIRMLRQMKQQEKQLESTHSINTSLEKEVEDLTKQLYETSNNNSKISAALLAEKHRLTELDETLAKSQNTQLAFREKEEQINDLMSEIKILQQNNTELISLSTKNSEVEVENIELRRKISEHEMDKHNLKSAFSTEQANIAALQAVNSQLMGKLQDLQRNMDTSTIQLKSYKNQIVKSEKSEGRKIVPTIDKMTSTSPRSCSSSKDESDYSSKKLQKLAQVPETIDTAVQTDFETPAATFCSTERVNHSASIENSLLKNHGKPVESMSGANLSRDEILKLLDQAQINVPLESHNAAKMRQFEGFSPVHRQRESDCSCESLGISNDFNPQQLIQNLWGILNEYNNVIVAKIQDKPAETVDGNNNTRTTKIQTSTARQMQKNSLKKLSKKSVYTPCNCDVNTSDCCEDYTEDENCPCDTINRPFTSAIDDIRVSLQKTIDSMQKPREKIKVKRYEVLPKPRNKVDCRQRSLRCDNSHKVPVDKNNSFCPILVTNQQGLVEIHISSLQLSSFAINHLFGDFSVSPSLFVSCDFCGQGSVFSPTQNYPTLTFNSSCAYRVSRISKFLDCLLRDDIYFQVHIVQPGGTPCIIAHGKLSVKDILDYPQNKLHYIANVECTVPCYRNANFGQIFFWIRLSCDVDRVRIFKHQRQLLCTPQYSEDMKKSEQLESKSQSNQLLNQNKHKESSQFNHISEQKLRSTDTSSENLQILHDGRKRDTHFESPPKSYQSYYPTTSASEKTDLLVNYEESRGNTLQKRADSWRAWSLGDHPIKRDEIRETIQLNQMNNVGVADNGNLFDDTGALITENWGRYKRKSLNSQANGSGDAVVIRIERLSLFPSCSLLNDRDVHQLYVEFSFLGNYGLDLETMSVPIPQHSPYYLYFNYMKKFDIDEKFHSDQRKKLQETMSDEVSSSIKFTIVNEPLMEEMETKECTEVGHAYLNLKEHVLSGGGHDISLIVSNTEGSASIGKLKITLLGADVIRNCIPQN